MRLKFHKGIVLSAIAIGFIVTLMTIAVASLATSPQVLAFVGPASLIWIILLVWAATRLSKKGGEG